MSSIKKEPKKLGSFIKATPLHPRNGTVYSALASVSWGVDQMLSCRPKRLYKPACYGWFFMPAFLMGEAMGNYWGTLPFFDTIMAAKTTTYITGQSSNPPVLASLMMYVIPSKQDAVPYTLLHIQVALLFAHFPS